MTQAQFKNFVYLLAELGYDNVDPELKLFHLIIKDDVEEVNEFLKNPKWADGTYNPRVTDAEIFTRYKNLLNLPWVQEKFKEMNAQNGRAA